MKKKIFIQTLLITVFSAAILFFSSIFVMYVQGRNNISNLLKNETRLSASLIKEKSDFELLKNYNKDSEIRITLIAENGNVLYESDTNAELENHLGREEVKSALNGDSKTIERYSSTFQCKMTYYAVRTTLSDSSNIVVRFAVKSRDIKSYMLSSIPALIVSLLVAIIISAIFANKMSKNISRKISAVGTSLKSLNSDRYSPIATDSAEPEFYTIFNEINELNESTHKYINKAERDRQKLNAVLENVSQSIVALNQKGIITFANRSALRLFSSSDQIIGKSLVYLIEDSSLYEKITSKLSDEVFKFEFVYEGKDLSVVGKHLIAEKVGGSMANLIIFTDITTEKTIMKQKSDFFANASHELKTPITIMRGHAELMLSKDNIAENDRKHIERIHKETIRLSSLISDMLKLSNLESQQEDEKIEVNLNSVAKEVAAELNDTALEKNVTIAITGEATILSNHKKMFELIENLCSNAVNYNKDGGKVDIILSDNDQYATLIVADTGIGIEKEHLPRLCERFYRVDKSHSKKTGGTGLGLAIVKHICALYDADLSIHSDIGIGTTVKIVFTKK